MSRRFYVREEVYADGLIPPISLRCIPFFRGEGASSSFVAVFLFFCVIFFSSFPLSFFLLSPQRSSQGDFTWHSARGRRRCLLLLPHSTLCQNPGPRLRILHRAYVADLFFLTLSSLHPCLLSARLRAGRFFKIVRKEWWIFVFFCVMEGLLRKMIRKWRRRTG